MSFTDYDFAIKFRDVIRKIVLDVLELERPPDKVARVVDIDRANGTARVVYPGDEVNSARVKMYPGIQPMRSDRVNGAGTGSIVRVSGPSGGRYIAQVMSDSSHQISPRLVNPTFSSGGSGDETMRSMFSFSIDGAPGIESWFPVIEVNFPLSTGAGEVCTEMIGASGETYFQRDRFSFDNTTPRNQDNPMVNISQSSAGMNLGTHFYIYNGELDGFPVGTTSLGIDYYRTTGSTKNPQSMNVHVDFWGTNVQLHELKNGAY